VFFLPAFIPVGSTFSSLDEFFDATDPSNPDQKDFRAMIGSGPFKGENIHMGLFGVYAQDDFVMTDRFTLSYGLRVDVPIYFTDPVDNPDSRQLDALDENDNPEIVDQSRLPDATPLLSPRIGFNWNAVGDRYTQVRGGTGLFTGRIPFVWIGNVISNPGANSNLYPDAPPISTSDDAILQQSFDLNAVVEDFKLPQVWTTNLALDQQLPWELLGTLEVIYSKDLNAIYMRNADLPEPVRTLPDGRPYFGGPGANELNADGGAGIYVLDNTDEGHSLNISAQLRRSFGEAFRAGIGYNYLNAKNNLKSTEIASVLWQNQPVRGDPNRPELSYSEFGQRHRIVADATYSKTWSQSARTQIGIFLEVAEGNRFTTSGGNRYSFIYAGDVNGDGYGGNDLIYIPRDQSEIVLVPDTLASGTIVSPAEQWTRLNAFIEQDDYLSEHRGEIAQRFGAVNPWYSTIDLRIMQDLALMAGGRRHALQISFDVLNFGNPLNSDWGVRKVALPNATSPLTLVGFDGTGRPQFNFTGPDQTYVDDPSPFSRWRAQLGVRYLYNQ
jgi:hypothetical protein